MISGQTQLPLTERATQEGAVLTHFLDGRWHKTTGSRGFVMRLASKTMQKSIQIPFEDRWQIQRFLALKEESRQRIGTDELTNGAFVTMLLDVWEHHQESQPGELQTDITLSEHSLNGKETIVRDTDVGKNVQTS